MVKTRDKLQDIWQLILQEKIDQRQGRPVLGRDGRPLLYLTNLGDNKQPLPALYIGISTKTRQIIKPQEYKGFKIECEFGTFFNDSQGRDYAVLSCLETGFSDLFISFSNEIADELDIKSSTHETVKTAIDKWLLFFKKPTGGPLQLEELTGVVGELLMLKELAQSLSPSRETIEAWQGPKKADWDYSISNGGRRLLVEVKTTIRPKTVVTVHNINQLSPKSNFECFLNFRSVDYVENKNAGDSFWDIRELIAQLEELFRGGADGDLSTFFWERLEMAGVFRSHLPTYDGHLFEERSSVWHIIDNDFPAANRVQIPQQVRDRIDSIKYRLNLAGLTEAKNPFNKNS